MINRISYCHTWCLRREREQNIKVFNHGYGSNNKAHEETQLLICDINMPVMDGWQTRMRIKELYTQKQIEIDQFEADGNEANKRKIITLQLPYFVFHTATYVDEAMRQKAK